MITEGCAFAPATTTAISCAKRMTLMGVASPDPRRPVAQKTYLQSPGGGGLRWGRRPCPPTTTTSCESNPYQSDHLADIGHLLQIPEAIQKRVYLP